MANEFRLESEQKSLIFTPPNICPICHNFVTINKPVVYLLERFNGQIVFHCPNSECGRFFIASYSWPSGSSEETKLLTMKPSEVAHEQMSEAIKETSPDFVLIYREAHTAKESGLLQICGAGYRKAFEFLIKDYAKRQAASEEEKRAIEKAFSGKVVDDYVENPRIQAVAKRALWLGNDETHYLRKWTAHDIEDLITLINLTIHWIEIERLTQEYTDGMPD
jgi:hypothetical protein